MNREGKRNPADAAKAALTRRNFLTGSAAVAAASGAVSLHRGSAGDREAKPSDLRRLEYHETDHIRKFYALSRF